MSYLSVKILNRMKEKEGWKMYQFITLLIGFMIAIMIVLNGKLSDFYGIYIATLTIHMVGSLFASIMLKIKKKKLSIKGIKVWLFLGGAIGVFTTIFNNFSFGKISMTAIIALGLLGQTVTALVIDSLGLLGMKKYKLKSSNVISLVFAAIGFVIMIRNSDTSALVAIVFSLLAGVTVVVARTVNARLAKHTGDLESSYINHLVGLFASFLALICFGRNEISMLHLNEFLNPLYYMGGILGVLVVLLFNIVVPKIPSVQITLLTFSAQVFTGIILDLCMQVGYEKEMIVGSLWIAIGVGISKLLEVYEIKRGSKQVEI